MNKSICCLLSLLISLSAAAQTKDFYKSLPKMPDPWFNRQHYDFGGRYNYADVSTKHDFKIVFLDGTVEFVRAKIIVDSPSHYIKVRSTSPNKDTIRYTRVYPSDTKYLIRKDMEAFPEYTGVPNDSCWIFRSYPGKINAFTTLAEDNMGDLPIFFIEDGNGQLINFDEKVLEAMITGDEKAMELFEKKKYKRAIHKFNKKSK